MSSTLSCVATAPASIIVITVSKHRPATCSPPLETHLEFCVRQQVGEELKYLRAVFADVPVLRTKPHNGNQQKSQC